MKSVTSIVLILAAIGCGPSMRGNGLEGDDTPGIDASETPIPKHCNKMDLIFVVDDSGSMSQEQSNLAANFPMFASLLSSYTTPDGEPIDYRVAVTTTGKDTTYSVDLAGTLLPFSEHGDNGAFKNNCSTQTRWLAAGDPTMNTTLSCRANVGTSGPSYEMPLLMTKWALAERMADNTNTGFLRDDALLGIVMLTDEDDQSTTMNNFVVSPTAPFPTDFDPSDLVGFLDGLKGHRSRWAAGVIAGPNDCTSSFGDATKATRLQQFVTLANGNGTTQASFSSICDGDLTIGLKKSLELFQSACTDVIY